MRESRYAVVPFNFHLLKGRALIDLAHVLESKYCLSPVHAVASTQASSFQLIARV